MPTPFGPDPRSETLLGALLLTVVLVVLFGGLTWYYLNWGIALGLILLIVWASYRIMCDIRDNWDNWKD